MEDRAQAPPASSAATVDHIRPEDESERTVEVEQLANALEKELDPSPDGGYGWVCVACNFFINGHTWGVNSSYGVFLAFYLNNDYFPGTSPLVYAFVGGLSMSTAMLIAPLATHIIHLYGTKTCLYLGVFFETLSLIGASFATKQWQIILSQGVCFGWGLGFLFVGSVGIIAQWFTKKRSVANSIAAAGSGLGGLMYSLVTQRAIDTLGLPWAFRILGICTFAVNLTASTLLRDRNVQTKTRHRAFDFGLLRRPEFLLVQGWSWFSMLGYVILLFSLSAYGRAIGLSAQQGAILGAILNLGQMLGRPFIGLSSDRWGRLNNAILFTFGCAICCFAFWIPAEVVGSPMGLLCFFAVVGGAMAGTFWTTIAPVAAEIVGLQDLPGALSWTWVIMVPPTTCAEAIALELRRQGVNQWIYLPPQIFTSFMYLAGALCLWVVRGWKVGEVEVNTRKMQARGRRHESILQMEKRVVEGHQVENEVPDAEIAYDIWKPANLFRNMCAWKII